MKIKEDINEEGRSTRKMRKNERFIKRAKTKQPRFFQTINSKHNNSASKPSKHRPLLHLHSMNKRDTTIIPYIHVYRETKGMKPYWSVSKVFYKGQRELIQTAHVQSCHLWCQNKSDQSFFFMQISRNGQVLSLVTE